MSSFPAVEAIPGVRDENFCLCYFHIQKIEKRGISPQLWDVAREYNSHAIALAIQAVNDTQMVEWMHREVVGEMRIEKPNEFIQQRIMGSST